MGLFKSGKNSKIEKYEDEQDCSKKKSSRHSSKKKPSSSNNPNGLLVRPMPQFSIMNNQFNPYSTFKSPFQINSPYDLMKATPPTSFPYYPSSKPYFNPIYQFTDRSPQYPLSIYQQNPFSNIQPSSNYPFIPQMNF